MNPVNPAEETLLWRGHPSQWTRSGVYLLCVLLVAADIVAYVMAQRQPLVLAGLALPVIWALAVWISTRAHTYELTTQRLREIRGVLARRTEELELYRVRDYTIVEPFWLRLVGCGHLILSTADRDAPEVRLRAIRDVAAVKEHIRTHTEQMRQARGVRDFEINPQ